MAINDRENVFPSRANLVATKVRLVSARKGLNMLKHKRDALDLKVRDFKQQLESLEMQKQQALQDGIMHIARARFHGARLEPYTMAQTKKADSYLLHQMTRVVGINIPTFEFKTAETNSFQYAGLAGGGEETQLARQHFLELLELLVSMASIKFSLMALEPVLKQTKTRCNAVEYVVIPKIEATRNYIADALDEQEREDFYRLKCSKAKQIKHKQEHIRRLHIDKKIEMQDFLGEHEIMHPDRRRSSIEYQPVAKKPKMEIIPKPLPQPMPQMLIDPSKEIQTDDVYEYFEEWKPLSTSTETQTDNTPKVGKSRAKLDRRHRIRKKPQEVDTKEMATDTAFTLVEEDAPRRRKRLKPGVRFSKNLQTDE